MREWGESFIRTLKDRTVVNEQRQYIGYGRMHYIVVGTKEGVLRHYDSIKRVYPPQGYGGYYPDPVDLGNDLWIGYPNHSCSCD